MFRTLFNLLLFTLAFLKSFEIVDLFHMLTWQGQRIQMVAVSQDNSVNGRLECHAKLLLKLQIPRLDQTVLLRRNRDPFVLIHSLESKENCHFLWGSQIIGLLRFFFGSSLPSEAQRATK